MLSSLFTTTRRAALLAAFIVLACALPSHAQIQPGQIDFAGGSCTSLQYYSPFDDTCHSIVSGGSPNGRVVSASTTAACGEFIRDNASGTSTITLPAVSTGCTVAVQRGVSAGVITIDPGATAYDGVTTQLPQGESVFIWTDGTGWHSNAPIIPGTGITPTAALTGITLAASSSASPSVVFNIATGVTATPAAPYLPAPTAGTVSHCYFTTLTADGSTNLVFNVKFNGTNILSGTNATVTAGDTPGTIHTFNLTSGTISITQGQKWELDISGGTSSWTGVAQCY